MNPKIISEWKKAFLDKASEKDAQEDYIKKVKEKRDQLIYRPKKTLDYKNTYLENIVYTEGFIETVQDEKFISAWTLALNKFFLNKLELSESVIVKFMPLERDLITELIEQSALLRTNMLEHGKNKMNETEDTTLKEMNKLFDDPIEFREFLKFRKNFYLKYLEEKKLDSKYET